MYSSFWFNIFHCKEFQSFAVSYLLTSFDNCQPRLNANYVKWTSFASSHKYRIIAHFKYNMLKMPTYLIYLKIWTSFIIIHVHRWRSFFSNFYCTINAFKVVRFLRFSLMFSLKQHGYIHFKDPVTCTENIHSMSRAPQQAIHECILCKHIENVMNCIRAGKVSWTSYKKKRIYDTWQTFHLIWLWLCVIFKYHSLYFESNIVMAPFTLLLEPAGIFSRAGVNLILYFVWGK